MTGQYQVQRGGTPERGEGSEARDVGPAPAPGLGECLRLYAWEQHSEGLQNPKAHTSSFSGSPELPDTTSGPQETPPIVPRMGRGLGTVGCVWDVGMHMR